MFNWHLNIYLSIFKDILINTNKGTKIKKGGKIYGT